MKDPPPDKKHGERKPEDCVSVIVAETVGELLGGGFLQTGILDELDDFLERTFGRGPGDEHLDGAPEVNGASQGEVADLFFHWRSLAGQIGFIRSGAAPGDFAINGELGAGFDEETCAGPDLFDGNLGFQAAGVDEDGSFWRIAEEGTDLLTGAAERVMLQRPGQGEQEEQDGAFGPSPNASGTDGHGQHEEMNVDHALLEALPDLFGGEKSAGQISDGEPGHFERIRGQGGGKTADTAERSRGELPFPFVRV